MFFFNPSLNPVFFTNFLVSSNFNPTISSSVCIKKLYVTLKVTEEGDGHAVASNTVKNVKEKKESGDQEDETDQEDQEEGKKEQGDQEEEKKEQEHQEEEKEEQRDRDEKKEHADQDDEKEQWDQEDEKEQWDQEEEKEHWDQEEEKEQGDQEVEKEQGDQEIEKEQGDQEVEKEQGDQGQEGEKKHGNQDETRNHVKRVSVSNIVSVLLENGEKMEQPVRDICSLPPGGGDPHWPGWPVSRVEEEEKRQLRQERRERELRMERRRKINYQVKEIQNVYNVVEESERADPVSKKRDEDWIVDDDGGYVEDGGEISDDEERDGGFRVFEGCKAEKKTREEWVKSNNIKTMLAMPSRKTEDQGKLEEDELLGDTVSNIAAKRKAPGVKKTKPVVSSAKVEEGAERSPFMKRGTGVKKTVKREPVSQAVEEEVGQLEEQEGRSEEEQINVDGFEDPAQEKEPDRGGEAQKEVEREGQEQDLELALECPWLTHEASSIKIQVLS